MLGSRSPLGIITGFPRISTVHDPLATPGQGVDLRLLPSREVSPAERLKRFYISLIVEIQNRYREQMSKKPNIEQIARYADMLSAMGTEPRLRIMRLLLSAHPDGLVVDETLDPDWRRVGG